MCGSLGLGCDPGTCPTGGFECTYVLEALPAYSDKEREQKSGKKGRKKTFYPEKGGASQIKKDD